MEERKKEGWKGTNVIEKEIEKSIFAYLLDGVEDFYRRRTSSLYQAGTKSWLDFIHIYIFTCPPLPRSLALSLSSPTRLSSQSSINLGFDPLFEPLGLGLGHKYCNCEKTP